MTILVDGHNLIGTGALPGISLDDEDDEVQLVSLLKAYKARVRQKIIVVFDRGLPGGLSRSLSGGGLSVRFASAGCSADDVIVALVHKSSTPGSVTVVTSDRELASRVRRLGGKVVSSLEFAAEIRKPPPRPEVSERERLHLSREEVEAWLALFSGSHGESHR